MQKIRKSEERGHAQHGWLNSYHTFSFANYHDPNFMGFHALRVINEDRIAGGTGFDSHPHNNMEIISYVVKGALLHIDSMGSRTVIKPFEVQRMSAGSGVIHSEYNQMENEETHFFQIWIKPNKIGEAPEYGQKSFEDQFDTKKLVLVASENGREGSLKIKQDADLYISRLKAGEELDFNLRVNRGAWIQMIYGHLMVNGEEIKTGDGVAVENEDLLVIKSLAASEFLLFDLS